MSNIYTLKTSLEYSKENKIEDWIHIFLNGEGDNVPFSHGLKLEKRFFIGPISMPLNLFERCCGPENSMKYQVNESNFNSSVNAISERYNSGWNMPPLIINYSKNGFELNDGNHRFEALKRLGICQYPVIIWITNKSDYANFIEEYDLYLNNYL